MKKKCLIVSYYLSPPENTPRAFHTQGMISAFEKSGYEVDVIIPENGYHYDNERIFKVSPYFNKNKKKYTMDVQRTYTSKNISLVHSLKKKVFSFINYFIWPDRTLSYAYFVYKQCKNLAKKYDIVFTITGPYSPMVAGYFIKRNGYAKKWVVDYGDPFSALEHGTTRFYDAYLEKKILSNVDYITIPTVIAKNSYLHLVDKNKIKIIPQQFQWNPKKSKYYIDNKKINMLYAGKMYVKRPPDSLVEFLKINNNENVVLHMFGDANYFQDFLNSYSGWCFKGEIIYNGFIDREELLDILTKMDYLINIEWPTSNQKPSKLIDYKLSNRSIINLPENINTSLKKQDLFKGVNYSFLKKNLRFPLDFIKLL